MPSAYLSEFSEVKKAWEKNPQQFTAINSVFLTMIHFLIFWMFYLLFIPNVYCLLLFNHVFVLLGCCAGWDGKFRMQYTHQRIYKLNGELKVNMQGTESPLQTSKETGCA